MLISAAPRKHGYRRTVDGITMLVVTGLSLLLLVYVGVGEGKRTYERLEAEKLISQGSRLQMSIGNNLRGGLPLKQFAGFNTLAASVLNGVFSIEEINAIAVYDPTGSQLFIALDETNPKLPPLSNAIKRVKQSIEIDRNETHTQVILPLRNRFETVGSLVVTATRDGLTKRVSANFQPLLFVVVALSAMFAIVVWITAPYIARTRTPWLQIGYALTFLTMAGAVVATLVTLYSEAVQAKIQASALTLSQRLSDVVEFKLNFEHIEGVRKSSATIGALIRKSTRRLSSLEGSFRSLPIRKKSASPGSRLSELRVRYQFIPFQQIARREPCRNRAHGGRL